MSLSPRCAISSRLEVSHQNNAEADVKTRRNCPHPKRFLERRSSRSSTCCLILELRDESRFVLSSVNVSVPRAALEPQHMRAKKLAPPKVLRGMTFFKEF